MFVYIEKIYSIPLEDFKNKDNGYLNKYTVKSYK